MANILTYHAPGINLRIIQLKSNEAIQFQIIWKIAPTCIIACGPFTPAHIMEPPKGSMVVKYTRKNHYKMRVQPPTPYPGTALTKMVLI